MGLLTSGSLSLRKEAAITDDEFRQLADFIYRLLGIDIPEKRRYLVENRLGGRLSELGLKSFTEYLAYLKHDPAKLSEIDRLIEKVTTNETSFFRDMSQLENFRDKILNPLIAARMKSGTKALRIWSAGCSSGEEPYTLAILVAEILRAGRSQWNISILGTDISSPVLAQAKKAVYGKYAFKTTPGEIVDRYFEIDGPRYQVRPEIREMVTFERVNLNSPSALKRVPRSDVIFCRNVIIYFDQDMKKRVINAFYDNLLPDGHLLLGHSETMHSLSRVFVPVPGMGSPVYRKSGERNGAATAGNKGD